MVEAWDGIRASRQMDEVRDTDLYITVYGLTDLGVGQTINAVVAYVESTDQMNFAAVDKHVGLISIMRGGSVVA